MFLHWDSTINSLAVLTGLALFVTILSLLFTVVQIRYTTRIYRARFLLDSLDAFFRDETIQSIFARIDWNEFSFDEHTSPMSRDAICLDHLLYRLDALGFLVRTQALKQKDMTVLSFRVVRVMEHPQIIAYLTYLEKLYQNEGMLIVPHQEARWLAQKLRGKAKTQNKGQQLVSEGKQTALNV